MDKTPPFNDYGFHILNKQGEDMFVSRHKIKKEKLKMKREQRKRRKAFIRKEVENKNYKKASFLDTLFSWFGTS